MSKKVRRYIPIEKVYKEICTRCGFPIIPMSVSEDKSFVLMPYNCKKCKSPYYFKPIEKKDISNTVSEEMKRLWQLKKEHKLTWSDLEKYKLKNKKQKIGF